MIRFLILGFKALYQFEAYKIMDFFSHYYRTVKFKILIYYNFYKILLFLILNINISIVYNNKFSPPTFGDMFSVLMLVRLLGFNSNKIDFNLIQHETRSDWSYLDKEKQNDFKRDQILLAKMLLKNKVNYSRIFSPTKNVDIKETQKKFGNFNSLRYDIAPGVLQLISGRMIRKNTFPKNFLLQKKDFPLGCNFRYVSWHVRRGVWGQERNTTEEMILADFLSLRLLFPNHKIMIFSSVDGINFARDALKSLLPINKIFELDEILVDQPSSSYPDCIQYLVNSDFYFQRLGGGLGEIMHVTEVPFVIIETPGYYIFYSNFRLLPWLSNNQIRTGLGKTFLTDPLESIIKNAHSSFI